ncbi:hypothetical protein PHBOTO_001493 [Pseudozyma hubeiensis]|nr:hypothetical protein PHBOTO_001493 [Pseudozyma hubeiensis]
MVELDGGRCSVSQQILLVHVNVLLFRTCSHWTLLAESRQWSYNAHKPRRPLFTVLLAILLLARLDTIPDPIRCPQIVQLDQDIEKYGAIAKHSLGSGHDISKRREKNAVISDEFSFSVIWPA